MDNSSGTNMNTSEAALAKEDNSEEQESLDTEFIIKEEILSDAEEFNQTQDDKEVDSAALDKEVDESSANDGVKNSSATVTRPVAKTIRPKKVVGTRQRRYQLLLRKGYSVLEAKRLSLRPVGKTVQNIRVKNKRALPESTTPKPDVTSERVEANSGNSIPKQVEQKKSEQVQPNPKSSEGGGPSGSKEHGGSKWIRKIGIASKNFPVDILSKDQIKQIEDAVLTKVVSLKEDDVCPKFLSRRIKKGFITFLCEDEITVNWLKSIVKTLCPWEGAELMVADENDFRGKKSPVVVGTFTNCSENTNEEIMNFIKAQNRNINTERWKIIKRWETDKKVCMKLAVDELSAEQLSKQDNCISFKFSKAYLSQPNAGKAKDKANYRNSTFPRGQSDKSGPRNSGNRYANKFGDAKETRPTYRGAIWESERQAGYNRRVGREKFGRGFRGSSGKSFGFNNRGQMSGPTGWGQGNSSAPTIWESAQPQGVGRGYDPSREGVHQWSAAISALTDIDCTNVPDQFDPQFVSQLMNQSCGSDNIVLTDPNEIYEPDWDGTQDNIPEPNKYGRKVERQNYRDAYKNREQGRNNRGYQAEPYRRRQGNFNKRRRSLSPNETSYKKPLGWGRRGRRN